MRVALMLGILMTAAAACAQPHGLDTIWTRNYRAYTDSNTAFAAITGTRDNGLVVAGSCCQHDTVNWSDGLIVKANAGGEYQWSRPLAGPSIDNYYAALGTSDGGVLATGQTSFVLAAAKYTASGDTEWVRRVGEVPSAGTDALQQANGDLLVAGNLSTRDHARAPALVRFTAQGDTVFVRRYPHADPVHNPLDHEDPKVVETWDHGFLLMADIFRFDWTATCGYLIRTTAAGDTVWTRTMCILHTDSSLTVHSICRADSGNYLISACAQHYDGVWPLIVLKVSDTGDTVWTRSYSFPGYRYNPGIETPIIRDPRGGYVVSATYEDLSAARNEGAILRLDDDGNLLWMGTYAYSEIDSHVRALALAADSSYLWVLDDQQFNQFLVLRLRIDSTNVVPPPLHTVSTFQLEQNYPNPFNPTTLIRFSLPQTERASLKIYNVNGRQVAVVVDGVYSAGEHSVTFNGSALSSGVYFARLQAGKKSQTQKLMLLR